MNLRTQLTVLNHHAYAIIGGEPVRDEIILILEKQHSIRTHGNADFFNGRFTSFTIDDAREVKAMHSTRPVIEDGKKIFILQMDSITVEAQNALLKLLEEPAEYAVFFIIIPSSHLLIPTVKSRLQLIESEGTHDVAISDADKELADEAAKFLSANAAKRLEIIKKLMDDITKEKKTKKNAIDFLNAIQSTVYAERGVKSGKSTLESIETARKYMNDRSPSMKMLLEYVALNI